MDIRTGNFNLDNQIFQNQINQILGNETGTTTNNTVPTGITPSFQSITTQPSLTLKPQNTTLSLGTRNQSPLQPKGRSPLQQFNKQ